MSSYTMSICDKCKEEWKDNVSRTNSVSVSVRKTNHHHADSKTVDFKIGDICDDCFSKAVQAVENFANNNLIGH